MKQSENLTAELPKNIYPVDYAGFWDFTPDGLYGDSLINVVDYPNAGEIAAEIARRYNNLSSLIEKYERELKAWENLRAKNAESKSFADGNIRAIKQFLTDLTQ